MFFKEQLLSSSQYNVVKLSNKLFAWGLGTSGQVGTVEYIYSLAQLSSGLSHTVAITSDNRLLTWGLNASGQLGDGTVINKSYPVQIGSTGWKKVSAGSSFTVAIRADDALFVWGNNASGQLGDNSTLNKSSPVQIGLGISWYNVGAGQDHALAVTNTLGYYAWGLNSSGQLGDNTSINKSQPTQVSIFLYDGNSNNSALTLLNQAAINTSVVPFSNVPNTLANNGASVSLNLTKLGSQNGTSDNITTPSFSGFSIGSYTDYTIECWIYITAWNNALPRTNQIYTLGTGGSAAWQQMGVISTGSIYWTYGGGSWSWNPAPLQSATGVISLNTWYHIAFVKQGTSLNLYVNGSSVANSTTTIGAGQGGTLFIGSYFNDYNSDYSYHKGYISNFRMVAGTAVYTGAFTPPTSPLTAISGTQLLTAVSVFPSLLQLDAATNSSYGIDTTGLLYSWGNNASGQLGDNTTTNKNAPLQIGSSSWGAVSGGNSHAAAIRVDGGLFTWGLNNAGQLGLTNTINRSSPVQIGSNSWNKVSAGNSFTLGIGADNLLYGWGLNNNYQIGINTATISRSSPVQITSGSWTLISTGGLFTTATNDNKLLYSWGNSAGGTLGAGTTITRSSPTLVSFNQTISQSSPIQIGAESWTSISNGSNFFVALRSDNLIYSWGTNSNGELGDNTTINKSSPVLIGTSSWTAISASVGGYTHAIRSDGTLWTWGLNIYGIGFRFIATSWQQISKGPVHTLALRSDGSLWSWGSNTSGQLGINNVISRSSPVQIGSLSNWTIVAAGQNQFSSAINSLGEYYVWGNNASGDLGLGNTINRSSPTVLPSNTGSWIFAAGSGGITNDGKLWRWGFNSTGTIGDNSTINKSSPVNVGVGTSFTFVIAYTVRTLAIDNLGQLWAWGNNTGGPLGTNNAISRSSPVQITTPAVSWTMVTTAGDSTAAHSLGITVDGALYAWGTNNLGQLGVSDTINRSIPIQIGASSWASVGAMTSASVAIDATGKLFAWGSDNASRLGDGLTVNRSSPIQITGSVSAYSTDSWKILAVNLNSTGSVQAIRDDGVVFGWGENAQGQLGDNTTVAKTTVSLITATVGRVSSPMQVGSGANWSSVNSGLIAQAAITNTGELYLWGTNTNGELGQGDTLSRNLPYKLDNNSWNSVSVGYSHTVAVRSDGALFTWGLNTSSQLGDGTIISKSSPVQINAGTSYTNASAGANHTLAIRSDGLLYAWGLNSFGQLGIVTDVYSWNQIAEGFSYAIAIREDDTLWGWGLNAAGQLGVDNALNASSPTQIGTSSWTQVSANNSTSIAIRSDGALFTWGLGTNLQLGDGTAVSKSSPVQIGTSSWIQVSMGVSHALAIDANGRLFGWGIATALNASTAPFSWTVVSENTSHTAAIRSDGLLFVWGLNSSGQIGDGTVVSKSSPTQIGTSSWISVSSGQNHTLGVTADYRLFAWGNNAQYQLGDNSTVAKSSPVQIGIGTSWSQVTAAISFSYAITTDNLLFVWGLGTSGQMGTLTTPYSYTNVAAGDRTSLAVRNDGRLYGWGLNTSFQIGDGSSISKSSPVQVAGTLSWNSVSAGINHTLAITNNGELYGWGVPTTGATGNYGEVYSWNMVAGTGDNTFFIRSDGSLWATGPNTLGVLGLNDTFARSSPVQVGTSSWIFVNAGGSASGPVFGITSDYKLFSWGANDSGQCADGTTIRKSSPVQVGVGSSWIQAATGGSGYSLMLKSDYTLWTAGIGVNGRLGLNDVISRSNPTQIGTSSWTQIAVGSASLAIRVDNTLWSWGVGNFGQLGIGVTTDRSSPVQVTTPGTGPWLAIAANEDYSLAISGAGLGTPYSVYFIGGANIYGQAGLNTAVGSISLPTLTKAGAAGSSFVQVTTNGLPNADFVNHALTSDGKMWAWGFNTQGFLGDGTNVNKSSPVLVTGTTSWSQLPKRNAGRLNYGIATNNILWGWGLTPFYVTYNEVPIQVSNPIQIGGNIRWASYNSPIYAINSEAGQGSWTSVAAGNSFSFGIKNNLLYGWGNNNLGQTGTNQTTTPLLSPIQIGSSSWTVVSASELGNFGGGINSSGELYMWGSGFAETSLYQNVSTFSWVQISNGWSHIVGLRSDGSLWTWGSSAFGQLGHGDTITRSSPTQIPGTNSWLFVAAGNYQTYALRTDGTLWSWGYNLNGSLGHNNNLIDRSSPVQIGTSSWAAIAANGFYGAYAILSNGQLYSWGQNDFGQLGITSVFAGGDVIVRSSPTLVTSTVSWTSISSAGRFVAAIKSDFTLWTWGLGTNGQLGHTAIISRSSPTLVTGSWKQVVAIGDQGTNTNAMAAIRIDNTLWSWGVSVYNGQNDLINRSSPTQIGASYWTQISSGGYSVLARDVQNRLFVWGQNFVGSLGLGDTLNRSSPTILAAPAGTSWTFLSTSSNNPSAIDTMTVNKALASDGNLYIWGGNSYFGLGTVDTINRSSPIQLAGSWAQTSQLYTYPFLQAALPQYTSSPVQIGTSSWTSLSAGTSHALAVRTDGTLWGWGLNSSYQLGLGATDNLTRSSPTQIGTDTNWSMVSAGYDHSMAIKTNNTLWGWGNPALGQIGAITTLYSWTSIGASNNTGAGVRSDGLLFVWGNNGNGQLGLNDVLPRSSPVQIGTDSWTNVSVGPYNIAMIRSDYTLWAAGHGTVGALGNNSLVDRSSPVQVSGGYSWNSVFVGAYYMAGITTDERFFTWGYNTVGQLGDGTTLNRSNPTLLSYYTAVSAGPTHIVAVRYDNTLWSWGQNTAGQLGDFTAISKSSPVLIKGFAYGPGTGGLSNRISGQDGQGRNGGNGSSTSTPTFAGGVGFGNGGTGGRVAADAGGGGGGGGMFGGGGGGNDAGGMSGGGGSGYANPSYVTSISLVTGNYGTPGNSSDPDRSTAGTAGTTGPSNTTTNCNGRDGGIVIDMSAGPAGNLFTSISPAISGKTTWTSADGDIALYTYGTYTFTAAQTFSVEVKMWGAGGGCVTTGANQDAGAGGFAGGIVTWQSGSSYRMIIGQGGFGGTWAQNSGGGGGGTGIEFAATSTAVLVAGGGGGLYQISYSGYAGAGGGLVGQDATQFGGTYNYGGKGATTNSSISFVAVSAGSSHSAVVTGTNQLYTWGLNNFGQLGDGTTAVNRSSPIQIGTQTGYVGLSSWTTVSCGDSHTIGVTTNGYMYAWGLNTSGQLGDNTVISKSIPVQIGFNSWGLVRAGTNNNLALTPNNLLYGWGINTTFGATGVGDTINRSNPTLIGNNIEINSRVPVQIPGSFNQVNAGNQYTIVRDINNNVFAFGQDSSGQLGL